MNDSIRRPIVRRALMALALLVLLPVWYLVSAPMLYGVVFKHFPAALPPIEVFVSPAVGYSAGSGLPGGELYRRYWMWCFERVPLQ